MSRRTATATLDPRDAAEALGFDTGSHRIPVVVEDIAVGVRHTVYRAKRANPLNKIKDCSKAMILAAEIYQQAFEHAHSGLGMGPLPYAADRVQNSGISVQLLPQERALSSATWQRIGEQAMGICATNGVVKHVLRDQGSLDDYDAKMRWRNGTAKRQLLNALDRLSAAYGL